MKVKLQTPSVQEQAPAEPPVTAVIAHEAAESFPDRAAGWQCMAHRDDWPEGLKKPIPIALAPLSARELWLEWDLSLRSEIARAEDPDA